ARSAPLRRGRRARLGSLLQSGRAGGGRPVPSRSARVTGAALESLLHPGGSRSWESSELTSLNRLTPSATRELPAGLTRSLDGEWEFRLVASPDEAPKALGRVAGWDTVTVPSLWTMLGYDIPQYTNIVMPFTDLPPRVPDANPTGLYRRTFSL